MKKIKGDDDDAGGIDDDDVIVVFLPLSDCFFALEGWVRDRDF